MPEDYEKAISSCGNMGQLRSAGEKVSGLQWQVGDSLPPCISLLHDLFTQAQWKGNKLDTVSQQVMTRSRNFGKLGLTLMPLLRVTATQRKQSSPKMLF